MNHKDIQKILPLYEEGALSPGVANKVTMHLNSCNGCREKFREYKLIRQDLGSIEGLKAPAGFVKNVHKRLGMVNKSSYLYIVFFRSALAVSITAAVFLIGNFLYKINQSPEKLAYNKAKIIEKAPAIMSRPELQKRAESQISKKSIRLKKQDKVGGFAKAIPEKKEPVYLIALNIRQRQRRIMGVPGIQSDLEAQVVRAAEGISADPGTVNMERQSSPSGMIKKSAGSAKLKKAPGQMADQNQNTDHDQVFSQSEHAYEKVLTEAADESVNDFVPEPWAVALHNITNYITEKNGITHSVLSTNNHFLLDFSIYGTDLSGLYSIMSSSGAVQTNQEPPEGNLIRCKLTISLE